MPVLQYTVEDQHRRAEEEGWGWNGDMKTESELIDLIYSLIRVTKPDIAVETGTYRGHGTQAISKALEANARGHLWTVELDPPGDYPKTERTTFVTANSIEWSAKDAPAGINFAFVDCSSDYRDRVKVFANLWSRMTPGGIICVHDIYFLDGNFLGDLSEAAGREPNLLLEALNGFALWTVDP